MNIVVGSGPAGISCAAGLLLRGEHVFMLDAGVPPPPEDEALLNQFQKGDKAAMEELNQRINRVPISKKGVVLKLLFGSDFPYRGVAEHLGFEGALTGLIPSLGKGGLSTVWGGASLPYLAQDIADWPITVEDLAPHYRATLARTGISGEEDGLSDLFPAYTSHFNPLRLSSQALRLLGQLNSRKESLLAQGIRFGQARVTIGPGLSKSNNCVYCGRCLNGCPYDAIYNSSWDIPLLKAQYGERFEYKPGLLIKKWIERESEVEVRGHMMQSGEPFTKSAERLYLGAGPISTTGIALRSMEAFDEQLHLLDSQYFILPLLSIKGNPQVRAEQLYTLSQLFLEINDRTISANTVHLQLYTYNDLMAKVMRKKLWFAPLLREIPISVFDQRLLVIQGYLHSSQSGKIGITVEKTAGGERLKVVAKPAAQTRDVVVSVIKKLKKAVSGMGLYPLGFGVDITSPGRGFHSGGSFPMRTNAGRFETDVLGRPAGFKRVHLVDSSVFPSIPATTITLSVMANAHRIGNCPVSSGG